MSQTPAVIRLVLVDDHQIVTEGLKATLELEPDLRVVGQAATGDEAVGLVVQTGPDVVLLDLKLRGETGVDVCRRILRAQPEVKVVILSTFPDEDSLVECIVAGAKGYVIKDVELSELKRIIRQAARGESVLDPQMTSRVLSRIRNQEERDATPPLNERQREVLSLLVDGLTNKEIGTRLFLSESTVKYHLRRCMELLKVDRRAGLVREVLRLGLLP